ECRWEVSTRACRREPGQSSPSSDLDPADPRPEAALHAPAVQKEDANAHQETEGEGERSRARWRLGGDQSRRGRSAILLDAEGDRLGPFVPGDVPGLHGHDVGAQRPRLREDRRVPHGTVGPAIDAHLISREARLVVGAGPRHRRIGADHVPNRTVAGGRPQPRPRRIAIVGSPSSFPAWSVAKYSSRWLPAPAMRKGALYVQNAPSSIR